MLAHLFVRTGANCGEIHSLGTDPVLVGRSPDCNMVLLDPHVSRQHFRVECRYDEYWIIDLGSKNCISINGIPTQEKKLEMGDEIYLGSTRILFLSGSSPSSIIRNVHEATQVFDRREQRSHKKFEMIGGSEGMRAVYAMIEKVAPVDSTVLIHGESGTGKELIARALHQCSPRASGSLVTVNCASIPRELAESELFGHEKGAFTGAHAQRLGKFELAHDGTLFLDEIGELPLESQAKLLRVLEERTVMRVGGSRDLKINVRVIAASHKNLKEMVASGLFREDLRYRLEVVNIKLPALRERGEDIAQLARHFLAYYRDKVGRRVDDFSPEALRKLEQYRWPGNVRELKNVIERAVIMGSTNLIEARDLLGPGDSAVIKKTNETPAPEGTFATLESVLNEAAIPHIKRALELAEGNKKKAADLLGVPRTSLYDLFKKYDIQ